MFRGGFRNQKNKDIGNGFSIRRVKGNGVGQPEECGSRFLEPFDSSVRDGNALSQGGGTNLFPCEKSIVDEGAGETIAEMVADQQPGLLEHTLLAAGIQANRDIVNRQKWCDFVH